MQPIVRENLTMVMNGELYNYKYLRKELETRGYRFKTDGDAEVFICYINEFGITKTLNKARGMYALAIFDSESHELILARDRLGIKPLYYSLIEGRLIVASEIRTIRFLLDLADENNGIERNVLYDYLVYGSMHESNGTCYKKLLA